MIKTRSIILHHYAYSDSSWIVKIFTEEIGIVSFIVKGGKKDNFPFKGALDSLTLSELVFNYNPNKNLQFIKEASIVNWFPFLRNNLLNQAKAQVMVEFLLKYAPQNVPLNEEFKMLEWALDTFNSENAPEETFSKWLLNSSEIWGYHLELNNCNRCKKRLTEPAADFFPETGAFICKDCFGQISTQVKEETLKDFWALGMGKPIENPHYVENALITYLRKHIGFFKELHSLKLLQEMRKICLPQKN